MHWQFLVELFFVGFCAGTIDAIAGGGGLITLPFLLSTGLSPQMILGTNKLQALVGTGSACWHFIKAKLLRWSEVRLGLITTAVGAGLGVSLAIFISPALLKKIIPIVLFFILIYVIFKPSSEQISHQKKMSSSAFYLSLGLCLGFYDGFLGSGVGSMWVVLLMYCLGMSMLQATAHAKVFNLNTNVISAILFAGLGYINYPFAAVMALGQWGGGRLGAKMAMTRGAKIIKPLLIIMTSINLFILMHSIYGGVIKAGWYHFLYLFSE